MKNNEGYVPYEVCTNDVVRPHFCVCPICKKMGTINCQACNVVKYCDVECQKKDFHPHKKLCKLL
jgi:MYND finger